MLVRLRGTLESVTGNKAIVWPASPDEQGLAYEVLVPTYLAVRLAAITGQPVLFHTIHLLEQQAQGASMIPRLIGFLSADERRFFELFTTVKGVGPRKALRALAEPPERLAAAIASRDTAALQLLPEIGKRLAETIIAELHGKVDELAALSASAAPPAGAAPLGSAGAEQAVAALVRLGETQGEARKLVQRVVEAKPDLTTADAILAAAVAHR